MGSICTTPTASPPWTHFWLPTPSRLSILPTSLIITHDQLLDFPQMARNAKFFLAAHIWSFSMLQTRDSKVHISHNPEITNLRPPGSCRLRRKEPKATLHKLAIQIRRCFAVYPLGICSPGVEFRVFGSDYQDWGSSMVLALSDGSWISIFAMSFPGLHRFVSMRCQPASPSRYWQLSTCRLIMNPR